MSLRQRKEVSRLLLRQGLRYLVDEDGTILKSLPMSDELAEVIEEQKRKFQEEHGREIGPNDKLFFDAPPLEHVEHFMVEAMKKAGLDPAIIDCIDEHASRNHAAAHPRIPAANLCERTCRLRGCRLCILKLSHQPVLMHNDNGSAHVLVLQRPDIALLREVAMRYKISSGWNPYRYLRR